MTQVDLADALAISKDSITRWERGLIEPSAGYIKQMASILDTSIAYLMGETDDPAQGAHAIIDGNTENLYVLRSGTRITIN